MRVANIQEEGRYAGPHKRMIEVAEGLKEYDVQTTLVLSNIEADILKEKLEDGDVYYRLLCIHKLTRNLNEFIAYWLFFIPETIKLLRLFKEIRPDIVHVNGSWQWKGVFAAKMARVPVVWHLSDTFMPWFIKLPFDIIKKYNVKYFIAACQRSVDFYLSDLKGKMIYVIQAPINTSVFHADKIAEDPSFFKRPGLNILNVGNITPVKGHDTLVAAIEIVNKEMPDIEVNYYIVGRTWGSQEKYYKQLQDQIDTAKLDNTILYGGSNQIKELLRNADIYVCSSNYEASPIAVWEALSMGLPIVSTDVGDVKVIFRNYEAGIVVPPQSPKELADAIIYLINDSSKREELRVNARKAAVIELDLNICVKRHLDCYTKIKADYHSNGIV